MPIKISYNNEVVAEINGLPKIGSLATDFYVTTNHLFKNTKTLRNQKVLILNILPNLVQEQISVRSIQQFKQKYQNCDDVVVLNLVSTTAHSGLALLKNGKDISFLLKPEAFAKSYGIGLKFYSEEHSSEALHLARSVIVIDKDGYIKYSEIVQDLSMDPNYQACFDCVEKLYSEKSLLKSQLITQLKAQLKTGIESKSQHEILNLQASKENPEESRKKAHEKAAVHLMSSYVEPLFSAPRNTFQMLLMADINRRIEDLSNFAFGNLEKQDSPSNSRALKREMEKLKFLIELARTRTVLYKKAAEFQNISEKMHEKLRKSSLATYLESDELLVEFINGIVMVVAKHLVETNISEVGQFEKCAREVIDFCLNNFDKIDEESRAAKLKSSLSETKIKDEITVQIFETFKQAFKEEKLFQCLVDKFFCKQDKQDSNQNNANAKANANTDDNKKIHEVHESQTNNVNGSGLYTDTQDELEDISPLHSEELIQQDDKNSAMVVPKKLNDVEQTLSNQLKDALQTQYEKEEQWTAFQIPPLTGRILQFSGGLPSMKMSLASPEKVDSSVKPVLNRSPIM